MVYHLEGAGLLETMGFVHKMTKELGVSWASPGTASISRKYRTASLIS